MNSIEYLFVNIGPSAKLKPFVIQLWALFFF